MNEHMNYYHELWFNASWMGQTNGDLMGGRWNPVLEKTHRVDEKCSFKATPSMNCGNGGGYHGDMMGLIHVRPHSYVCCLFTQLEQYLRPRSWLSWLSWLGLFDNMWAVTCIELKGAPLRGRKYAESTYAQHRSVVHSYQDHSEQQAFKQSWTPRFTKHLLAGNSLFPHVRLRLKCSFPLCSAKIWRKVHTNRSVYRSHHPSQEFLLCRWLRRLRHGWASRSKKKTDGSSPVSEAKGNDSMKAIDGDVRLFQNRWFPSFNCNRIWACGTPRFETEQSFLNPPQQPEISALKKTTVQGAFSVGMMMIVVPSFSGQGARAFATGQMGVVSIRPTLKPINSIQISDVIGYAIPCKKKRNL